MRPDFYRVVTERPRGGSSNPNRKTRFHINRFNECIENKLDSLPHSEKMTHYFRQRGTNCREPKDFSDVLSPIKRFLHSRIGRKWDDIYSEIRKVLPEDSAAPVRHIWTAHIKAYIELRCMFGADGRLWDDRGKYEVTGFYVHPVTHTLEYIKPISWRTRERNRLMPMIGHGLVRLKPKPSWSDTIEDKDVGANWSSKYVIAKVDDTTRAVRINGIWELYFYQVRKPKERIEIYYVYIYGKYEPMTRLLSRLRFVEKKQANRRELRRLGLRNDPPKIDTPPPVKFKATIVKPRMVNIQRGSFLLCFLDQWHKNWCCEQHSDDVADQVLPCVINCRCSYVMKIVL